MPGFVTAIGGVSARVIVLDRCLDILAALWMCFAAENGLMTFASTRFMQWIFTSLEGQLRRADQNRQWAIPALLVAPVFLLESNIFSRSNIMYYVHKKKMYN